MSSSSIAMMEIDQNIIIPKRRPTLASIVVKPDRHHYDHNDSARTKLYFRIEDGKDRWYVIDPDRDNSPNYKEFKHIHSNKMFRFRSPPYLKRSSCAVIASTIYLCGGIDRSSNRPPSSLPSSNQVYYFDTSRPEEGWREAPSMNAKRIYHYVFADKGKLYAVGGDMEDGGMKPYAEVYNPASVTNKYWEVLVPEQNVEDLPCKITGHAVLDPDVWGEKVLFHGLAEYPLSYYDVGLQSAGVHYEKFGGCLASAYIDGVLYILPILKSDHLYAYDVTTPEIRPKLVMFMENKKCLPRRDTYKRRALSAFLVPLGNRRLALVWTQQCPTYERGERLRVYCSKLQMSTGSYGFKAELLSHSRYTVKRGEMTSCLAVLPSVGVVGLDDKEIGEKSEGMNMQQQTTTEYEKKRKMMMTTKPRYPTALADIQNFVRTKSLKHS